MAVSVDDLKTIITAGTYAPSGDNSQPWEFRIRRNIVELYNLPDRDLPFYNFEQRGSFVSHGGVIENMAIASSTLGYVMDIALFPNSHDRRFVARLEFRQAEKKHEPLYTFIPRRATNRKPYEEKALSLEQNQVLLDACRGVPSVAIHMVHEKNDRVDIGIASALNERIALESQELHDDFFGHIVWTEDEERNKKSGLYLKTMEFPPPVAFVFRQLRSWSTTRFLNRFGLSRLVAKGNAKLYAQCAAIGAVTIQTTDASQFVLAGRVMQRIWLETARMGLSLQPVTGVVFLINKLRAGVREGFSENHIKLLNVADQTLRRIFTLRDSETIAMVFRVGAGGEPSARSSRLPPNIVTIEPA